MDWIDIVRDDFVTAVKVLSLIQQRAGILSSDYVKATARKKELELALSSSVNCVVRVPWKGTVKTEGEFFIDRRLLLPFVLLGEKKKIDFKLAMEEGLWHLKQGSRLVELVLRSEAIAGYGSWIDLKGTDEITLSEKLRKMLIASQNCATADPALQHLNCVYIGKVQILSSNRNVIFVGEKQSQENLQIPFPIGIISLLGETLVKAVGVLKDRVILDCGCGHIESAVSEEAQKNFPKKSIGEQIEKARKWPLVAKIPVKKLAESLTRMSDCLAGVRREDWRLKVELEEEKARLVVKVMQGKVEESFTTDKVKDKALLEWPLDLVQPILVYMKDSEIETLEVRTNEEKKTPYLLEGDNVALIIGRRN